MYIAYPLLLLFQTSFINELAAQGRRAVNILGDGNCLFRALGLILYNTEMSHDRVRQLLVDFVSHNKANFLPYSNNIEEHLGRMRYQRCWGTALEILAAASLLQMPIYTFTSAGSKQGRYRWVCYKPLVESALTWFPEDEPYPRKAFEMSHIELLHSGGCHYDCIVDQDGESPLAVPIQNPNETVAR